MTSKKQFLEKKLSTELFFVKSRYICAYRDNRLYADLTQPRNVSRALPVVSALPVVRNERPQGVDKLHLTYEGGVSDLSSSVCVMVAHHIGVFLTLSGRRITAGTWDYFRFATPVMCYRPRSSHERLLIVLLCNGYFKQSNRIISNIVSQN